MRKATTLYGNIIWPCDDDDDDDDDNNNNMCTVVVNFLSQVIFVFLLFLGMVM